MRLPSESHMYGASDGESVTDVAVAGRAAKVPRGTYPQFRRSS